MLPSAGCSGPFTGFLRLKNFMVAGAVCHSGMAMANAATPTTCVVCTVRYTWVWGGVCGPRHLSTPEYGEEAMGSGGRRGSAGQLRIIGGRWRSRRLGFPAVAGLRPTTDRVRETLFNWLAPQLPGARCADLFAGSGALGLEALSRGAAHCDFVDRSERASSAISKHLLALDASDSASCHAMTAERFLERSAASYDLVFIDPPFGADLLEPTCNLLDNGDRLAPGAMIYLETAAQSATVNIPRRWTLHREKVMGGVLSRLYTLPG